MSCKLADLHRHTHFSPVNKAEQTNVYLISLWTWYCGQWHQLFTNIEHTGSTKQKGVTYMNIYYRKGNNHKRPYPV